MAQAIRSVSTAQGYDPRDYVLVAFGGAAPQHACAVARELQIRQVLDPPDGSVLSALGMGLADVTRHVQQGVYRPLKEVEPWLEQQFTTLEDEAMSQVTAEAVDFSERLHTTFDRVALPRNGLASDAGRRAGRRLRRAFCVRTSATLRLRARRTRAGGCHVARRGSRPLWLVATHVAASIRDTAVGDSYARVVRRRRTRLGRLFLAR